MWGNAATRASRGVPTRVVIGVLVMAGSVLVGVRLTAPGEQPVTLMVAARDLAAGTQLRADDLDEVSVSGMDPGGYLFEVDRGSDPWSGRILTRDVAAGELLPSSAIAEEGESVRLVPVPVESERIGPDLGHGSRVDVWATDPDTGRARLVLAGAVVEDTRLEGDWAVTTATVMLRVAEDRVADVVSATRGELVDLIVVEGGSRS